MTYKRPLCFPFSENLLDIVSWFLFFCVTSSVSGTQSKGRFFFNTNIRCSITPITQANKTLPYLKGECGDDIQHENRYYLPKSKNTTLKSYYSKVIL